MGRKYGLGKYGANTYDLTTVHNINLFSGTLDFVVTVSPASYGVIRRFMGSMIVPVTFSGNFGYSTSFHGNISFTVTFTIGEPLLVGKWSPDTDDNWCDVPEVWIPLVEPDLPCKAPL